jgi:hypothetical protein
VAAAGARGLRRQAVQFKLRHHARRLLARTSVHILTASGPGARHHDAMCSTGLSASLPDGDRAQTSSFSAPAPVTETLARGRRSTGNKLVTSRTRDSEDNVCRIMPRSPAARHNKYLLFCPFGGRTDTLAAPGPTKWAQLYVQSRYMSEFILFL